MRFKQLLAKLEQPPQTLEGVILKAVDDGTLNWRDQDRTRPPSLSFNVGSLGRCLRQSYYARLEPPKFSTSTLRKFRAGTDTAQRVLDYLVRAGRYYGFYRCNHCSFLSPSLTIPTRCEKCSSNDMSFPEIGIRDVSIGDSLSGKMDLFVVGPTGRRFVGEIKAVSSNYRINGKKDSRKRLVKSLRGYIQQANMYVGLLRRLQRLLHKGKDPKIILYEDHLGQTLAPETVLEGLDTTSFALLCEDKNSCDVHPFEFIYDHDMYLQDRQRVKDFFGYVAREELPPREKLGCYFCDFKERCNRSELPPW